MNVETCVETGRIGTCGPPCNVLKGKRRPLAGTGRQTGLKIRGLRQRFQPTALKQMPGHSANESGKWKRSPPAPLPPALYRGANKFALSANLILAMRLHLVHIDCIAKETDR